MELPVEERSLAETGPGLDPEVGRRLRPAGARDQDPLTRLAIDQQEGQEVVAQGLVVQALDDRPADGGLGFRRGDRRAEAQESGLPQSQVALGLDGARGRRGIQGRGSLRSMV